jgi:hypothetical protein
MPDRDNSFREDSSGDSQFWDLLFLEGDHFRTPVKIIDIFVEVSDCIDVYLLGI